MNVGVRDPSGADPYRVGIGLQADERHPGANRRVGRNQLTGRAVGYAVVAALQDPRKDVLAIRNLFPDRIAMRLDEPEQVDMVLGDGARDRGAACELISTDPATGAGVAFVRLEADPDPVRVRAGWVTDADIRDMAAACLEDLGPRAIEAMPV